MNATHNEPARKAQREREGFVLAVAGTLGIVSLNEIPPRIAPEIASALAPVMEVSTLLVVIPTLLGGLMYATGGSKIVKSMLNMYFAVIIAVTVIGVLAIPLVLWTGMVP